MNNPNTFDEARDMSQALLRNEQTPIDGNEDEGSQPMEEGTPAETNPAGTEEPTAQQPGIDASMPVMEQAVQTAEAATEAAVQKDNQLSQVMAELESLRQQNQQLQGTIDEISKQNTEEIINDALEPPMLDVNALAFADDETVKKAQADYAIKMSEYNRNQIMKELSPFIEQAKEGMLEKEKNETINVLAGVPELEGIKEMLPQLERIIKNNSALSAENVPLDEKYITAYAIAKGVNSINNPPVEKKEPTTEELMELYNNNPAFQELVEKQRIESLKQSQQVPPMSASMGAVNAALHIKDKPQSFDEVLERLKSQY